MTEMSSNAVVDQLLPIASDCYGVINLALEPRIDRLRLAVSSQSKNSSRDSLWYVKVTVRHRTVTIENI
jgi:hypothetical protein